MSDPTNAEHRHNSSAPDSRRALHHTCTTTDGLLAVTAGHYGQSNPVRGQGRRVLLLVRARPFRTFAT